MVVAVVFSLIITPTVLMLYWDWVAPTVVAVAVVAVVFFFQY
jgi:hypothetical protein